MSGEPRPFPPLLLLLCVFLAVVFHWSLPISQLSLSVSSFSPPPLCISPPASPSPSPREISFSLSLRPAEMAFSKFNAPTTGATQLMRKVKRGAKRRHAAATNGAARQTEALRRVSGSRTGKSARRSERARARAERARLRAAAEDEEMTPAVKAKAKATKGAKATTDGDDNEHDCMVIDT